MNLNKGGPRFHASAAFVIPGMAGAAMPADSMQSHE